MICPPEVRHLRRLARARASSSDADRAWILRMLRYQAVAAALRDVRGDAAETVALARELVELAPSVGDPLGVERFFSAYLAMMDRVALNENNSEFRASVRTFIVMVNSEGVTGRWLVVLREQLKLLDECARVEASAKATEDELAEIESRLAMHDEMTPAEQMKLQADIEELDQRVQWGERSRRSTAAVKAPERAAFRCWRRTARRAPRRAVRRCSARRATCDAGGAAAGEGDGPGDPDGPRPRRSLLRAYGVAPVRSPGGRGVKPRPHARGSERPKLGFGVACGRGPYPSVARACAALWRRRFQGPPRGPVRVADGGGHRGSDT